MMRRRCTTRRRKTFRKQTRRRLEEVNHRMVMYVGKCIERGDFTREELIEVALAHGADVIEVHVSRDFPG